MKISDIQCSNVLNEAFGPSFNSSTLSRFVGKIRKGAKELLSLEGRGRRQIETLTKDSFRQWKKNSQAFETMGGQTYFNAARHFAFISLPNFGETPLVIADVVQDMSRIPVDEKRAIVSFIKRNAANRRSLISKSPPAEVQSSKKISDSALMDFYRRLSSKIYLLHLAKQTDDNVGEDPVTDEADGPDPTGPNVRSPKTAAGSPPPTAGSGPKPTKTKPATGSKPNGRTEPKTSGAPSGPTASDGSASPSASKPAPTPSNERISPVPKNMDTDQAVDFMFKHLFSKFSDDEIEDMVEKIQDRLSGKNEPGLLSRLAGVGSKAEKGTTKSENKVRRSSVGSGRRLRNMARSLENATKAIYNATKDT